MKPKKLNQRDSLKTYPARKTKQRIRHFPKMYYRMKDGLIHIHVEITLGKYQDQLLHLEKQTRNRLVL